MPSLTPLAFAALGLLNEGPTHPYEMFQTMIAPTGRTGTSRSGPAPCTTRSAAWRSSASPRSWAPTGRATVRSAPPTPSPTPDGRPSHDGLRPADRRARRRVPRLPPGASPRSRTCRSDEAGPALRARVVALEPSATSTDEILGVVRAKDLPERYWLDVSYVRAMLTAQIEWLAATADRIAAGHIPWDGLPSRPQTPPRTARKPLDDHRHASADDREEAVACPLGTRRRLLHDPRRLDHRVGRHPHHRPEARRGHQRRDLGDERLPARLRRAAAHHRPAR